MKHQAEIEEYKKRVEKMKKMIHKKDEKLEEKYIERISTKFCAKKYKEEKDMKSVRPRVEVWLMQKGMIRLHMKIPYYNTRGHYKCERR